MRRGGEAPLKSPQLLTQAVPLLDDNSERIVISMDVHDCMEKQTAVRPRLEPSPCCFPLAQLRPSSRECPPLKSPSMLCAQTFLYQPFHSSSCIYLPSNAHSRSTASILRSIVPLPTRPAAASTQSLGLPIRAPPARDEPSNLLLPLPSITNAVAHSLSRLRQAAVMSCPNENSVWVHAGNQQPYRTDGRRGE